MKDAMQPLPAFVAKLNLFKDKDMQVARPRCCRLEVLCISGILYSISVNEVWGLSRWLEWHRGVLEATQTVI